MFWRMVLIGLCVLILCSCRAPSLPEGGTIATPPAAYATLPPQAFTGNPGGPVPVRGPLGPPGMELGVPVPYTPTGPWTPPGISGPWPRDEYVCDGGDSGVTPTAVTKGDVRGLEMENTVARFDTLDGRTLVEPSNRVCLYAPRFNSVRQVVSLEENEQVKRTGGLHMPEGLRAPASREVVGNAKQNLQAQRQIAALPAESVQTRQWGGALSSRIGPQAFQDTFLAFENVAAIRQGVLDESETAFLARGTTAAVAWTKNQAAQVILDEKAAKIEISGQRLQTVYTVDAPPANPRLRLIKVASSPFAEPGEDVAFTIRFDNVGNQPIARVAILDSLSTRLEYVPESAQCSVTAKFSAQPNEGESVVVRCDLSDPLQPGKGGVLRFRCRVR